MRHQSNPEPRRAHAKVYQVAIRAEILALYGNACQQCGDGDLSTLQIHHTSGGKKEGYPAYPLELRCSGAQLWRAIIKWVEQHNGSPPPAIECLCLPCHKVADAILCVVGISDKAQQDRALRCAISRAGKA